MLQAPILALGVPPGVTASSGPPTTVRLGGNEQKASLQFHRAGRWNQRLATCPGLTGALGELLTPPGPQRGPCGSDDRFSGRGGSSPPSEALQRVPLSSQNLESSQAVEPLCKLQARKGRGLPVTVGEGHEDPEVLVGGKFVPQAVQAHCSEPVLAPPMGTAVPRRQGCRSQGTHVRVQAGCSP